MTKAELVKTLKEQAGLAALAQAEAAYEGLSRQFRRDIILGAMLFIFPPFMAQCRQLVRGSPSDERYLGQPAKRRGKRDYHGLDGRAGTSAG